MSDLDLNYVLMDNFIYYQRFKWYSTHTGFDQPFSNLVTGDSFYSIVNWIYILAIANKKT